MVLMEDKWKKERYCKRCKRRQRKVIANDGLFVISSSLLWKDCAFFSLFLSLSLLVNKLANSQLCLLPSMLMPFDVMYS